MLNCVSYEPFSDPNYPSNVDLALKNTLSLVVAQGFKCIKTYYAQYYGLKIADYAKTYNLKIVIGIQMGQTWTESEITTAIASCNNTNVVAIYAGNENLPNTQNVLDLITIRNRLKTAGCKIPFGTVQTFTYYMGTPDANVMSNMDWFGYNIYPFFTALNGLTSQNMLRAQISALKNKYPTTFQKFIISETGWPSAGLGSPQGNPSTLANAKQYADYFASMLCSGEIGTAWVSYFVFNDPTYKTNVPDYENHFGLIDPNGWPKWNITNLHC